MYLGMCEKDLVLLIQSEHGPHEPVCKPSIGQEAAKVVQGSSAMKLQQAPYAVHTYAGQLAVLCHIVFYEPNQHWETLHWTKDQTGCMQNLLFLVGP